MRSGGWLQGHSRYQPTSSRWRALIQRPVDPDGLSVAGRRPCTINQTSPNDLQYPFRTLQRPGTFRDRRPGGEGHRLRIRLAHPGGDHSGDARRRGHPRTGADRHRQDRGVRTADPVAPRHEEARAAGAGAGADARARHPGGRSIPEIRRGPTRIPRAADLWRPELRAAAQRTEARPAGHRRHAGPDHRPSGARHAAARRHPLRGARRSGRDAGHGFRRCDGGDPFADAGGEAGGAVLARRWRRTSAASRRRI